MFIHLYTDDCFCRFDVHTKYLIWLMKVRWLLEKRKKELYSGVLMLEAEFGIVSLMRGNILQNMGVYIYILQVSQHSQYLWKNIWLAGFVHCFRYELCWTHLQNICCRVSDDTYTFYRFINICLWTNISVTSFVNCLRCVQCQMQLWIIHIPCCVDLVQLHTIESIWQI
jgi:hypothetical protein